jgi:hypothetical protein
MQIRKVIDRRIRRVGRGVDVVGDVSGAVAVNVNEPNGAAAASTHRTAERSRSTAASSPEPESHGPRKEHA